MPMKAFVMTMEMVVITILKKENMKSLTIQGRIIQNVKNRKKEMVLQHQEKGTEIEKGGGDTGIEEIDEVETKIDMRGEGIVTEIDETEIGDIVEGKGTGVHTERIDMMMRFLNSKLL